MTEEDGGTDRTARGTNRLTDRTIKGFIAQTRAGTAPRRKLTDGGGLLLTLTPAFSPVWRVRYRFSGKERLATPGRYPEVLLSEARAARDAIRKHLRYDRDPSIERTNRRAASMTFREVAHEWLEMRRKGWSKIHHEKSGQALERDVISRIGFYRVGDITAAVVGPVVEAIAKRGSPQVRVAN